jgi:hypothetical protein
MTYPPYQHPADAPGYDPVYPPVWPAPAPVWGPPPLRAAAPAGKPWLVPVLVGGGGLLLGLLVATLLMTVVYTSAAEQIGRGVAEGFTDGVAESMGQFAPGFPSGPIGQDVEQTDPVPPDELGADPVLDQYAADCFAGDFGACDDLYYLSPPLSAYEEYGGTCGGRVKIYAVMSCTELE